MTEKSGYTDSDRPVNILTISDYQREYDRRTFEYVAEHPSVIKEKEGLINLHFDIEAAMKIEGYDPQKLTIENEDDEFIRFPITINPDYREEEDDYEIDEDEKEESLQDRLNREIKSNYKPSQSKQKSQDYGISM